MISRLLLVLCLCFCTWFSGAQSCFFNWFGCSQEKPKYVFLFIGDGMSTPQRMLAEEYALKSGYGPLVINHLPHHATTRTCSANSLVTDSAASATAIACGVKTDNYMLGITPDGKKVDSIAVTAKQNGKKVGIITTVPVNHATPAAFYAHRSNRKSYYAIGLDLVASDFDYFAGGGFLEPNGKDENKPQPNLYELAAKAGYTIVRHNAEEFHALQPSCGKVICCDADSYLPMMIDRVPENLMLKEFVAKGIDLLDNPEGFFMMVEGGMIDSAGHANDAASNVREVLAFDEAVKVALVFMEKHPEETLIVVTGDHETGGLALGLSATGYAIHPELLAMQSSSAAAFAKQLNQAKEKDPKFNFEKAKPMLRKAFGFAFTKDEKGIQLSKNEIAELQNAYQNNKLPSAASLTLAHRAGLGWSTNSHSALPVLTTSTGCGAEKFTGFIDNTDIAKNLRTMLEK